MMMMVTDESNDSLVAYCRTQFHCDGHKHVSSPRFEMTVQSLLTQSWSTASTSGLAWYQHQYIPISIVVFDDRCLFPSYSSFFLILFYCSTNTSAATADPYRSIIREYRCCCCCCGCYCCWFSFLRSIHRGSSLLFFLLELFFLLRTIHHRHRRLLFVSTTCGVWNRDTGEKQGGRRRSGRRRKERTVLSSRHWIESNWIKLN